MAKSTVKLNRIYSLNNQRISSICFEYLSKAGILISKFKSQSISKSKIPWCFQTLIQFRCSVPNTKLVNVLGTIHSVSQK